MLHNPAVNHKIYPTTSAVYFLHRCSKNYRTEKINSRRYTCIYSILFWEFFPAALTDGLSVEFEWQEVSSSLQDPSQYSSRSQYCCSLNGNHSFSYLHTLQSLYQFFGICSETAKYNKYHCHLQQFFSILLESPYIYPSFRFLSVLLSGQLGPQNPQFGKFSLFSFFFWSAMSRSGHLVEIKCSLVSQNPSGVVVHLILQDSFSVVYIPFFKLLAKFPVDHLSKQVMPSHILVLS